MNKTEFINKIATKNEITKKAALEMVEIVIENLKEAIIEEGEVNLSGFAKFTKAHKEARTGVNPRTGEKVDVPAKTGLKCKFSGTFKDAVNA